MALGSGNKTGKSTLFVPSLHTKGVLSKNMFSVYIGQDVSDSYIDFGTPDTSVMTSESDIVWINSTNVGGWWTANVIGWRYTGSSDEVGLTSTWALTDTGSSCLYGPS